MGREDEAISTLVEGDVATNGDIAVLVNLATLLLRRACHEQIEDIAKRVFVIAPNHALMGLTLGVTFLKQGRIEEGVSLYRRLVNAHPDNPDLFINMGELLLVADAYSEALIAFQRASTLSPTRIESKIGQWQALAMLERFEEADQLYSELITSSPKEAMACFRRMAAQVGQRISPDWTGHAVEIFLSRCWSKQQICDWRFRSSYLKELRHYAEHLNNTDGVAQDGSLTFQTMAAPLSPVQRRGLLDAVARRVIKAAPHQIRNRLARPSGPLRIGFLSTGFREHPSAQLHWRHFALYDRRRFRVHAYSLADDPSNELRQRVAHSVDMFRDLSRATLEEIGWRIARDGIDILVDLAGYQDNARPEILAARPAPLRVSYHGPPISMGNRLIDYRISDRIASPDTSEFTEAVAFIPAPHYMYNDAEPIAARIPSRQECELPDTGIVFCAFNNAFKIEPEVFRIWMELLREFPDSALWLSDGGTQMRDNLRREASVQGIAGERLVFAPRIERAAHLARHACADLFLDTFLCNAHTTAIDALWAGLPVLTRAGDTMTSRFAASLVTSAGLPELVVSTTEGYLTMARNLASAPERLAGLRQRLAANRKSSRLFATERRVRHLERAFETMWERHCRGEPPASFDVPDEETRS